MSSKRFIFCIESLFVRYIQWNCNVVCFISLFLVFSYLSWKCNFTNGLYRCKPSANFYIFYLENILVEDFPANVNFQTGFWKWQTIPDPRPSPHDKIFNQNIQISYRLFLFPDKRKLHAFYSGLWRVRFGFFVEYLVILCPWSCDSPGCEWGLRVKTRKLFWVFF